MAGYKEDTVVIIRKVGPLSWEANIVSGRTVYSYYALTERGARRAVKRHENKMADWD